MTLENIEEVFLDKASSRGPVGEDDVVAYFIERGHVASGNGDSCCNIEYFNPRSLRKFLRMLTTDRQWMALFSIHTVQ